MSGALQVYALRDELAHCAVPLSAALRAALGKLCAME
jgi:hypothetical protein